MTTIQATEDRPLTAKEMQEIRETAKTIFQDLEQQAQTSSPASWIRPEAADVDAADASWLHNRKDQCRYFDTNGFLVVSKFVDATTVQSLKDQMAQLSDKDWDPSITLDTFGTDRKSNTARGDYFLDSSNRVHFFAELDALEEEEEHDKTKQHHQQLKPEFQTNKLAALNKAGHGMHTIPGAFCDYTTSSQVRELVTNLGWQDPVVPQSMYIFKQPRIGGTVHSHQDSTFLYTTPKQSCLGLWLALDDATLENGCLWVRPGSHQEPVRRQFIRNPDYFETNNNDDEDDDDAEVNAPKLIFVDKNNNKDHPDVPWEGSDSLPKSGLLLEAGFVPVECRAGDVVAFPGQLDHLSLPNFSKLPRHTFQLHLVEGPRAGVTWSDQNWLQYPPGVPFVSLLS
jgi:phytanoyl-CoA hydroxylase